MPDTGAEWRVVTAQHARSTSPLWDFEYPSAKLKIRTKQKFDGLLTPGAPLAGVFVSTQNILRASLRASSQL
jgi:hypothetical protein